MSGVWNDMNEPAVFEMGTFPDDVRHNYDGLNVSHRMAHNVYGMQMARATYEGIKHLNPNERPFVLTRSGFSGVQRYAAVWTGDNVASWEHIWVANMQCQRLSISGISFAEPTSEVLSVSLMANCLCVTFRWPYSILFQRSLQQRPGR